MNPEAAAAPQKRQWNRSSASIHAHELAKSFPSCRAQEYFLFAEILVSVQADASFYNARIAERNWRIDDTHRYGLPGYLVIRVSKSLIGDPQSELICTEILDLHDVLGASNLISLEEVSIGCIC